MDRGLYVAASGMMSEMARLNAISNNLANVNTAGYKADRTRQTEFASMLLANRASGETVGVASLGVVSENVTDLSQAAVEQTGQPLDFAISGDGYFAVGAPGGVRYTRNGEFTVGQGGVLVTGQGYPVLNTQGEPITVGGDQSKVSVRADGTVTVDGQPAGQMQVVALQGAVKEGANLLAGQPAPAAGANVVQGSLESSGVDATQSVVEMIASQRSYDAGQRAMRTLDEVLARSAQIGQVN